MKKSIFLIALIFTALSATAQGKFKITGRTVDGSAQPISYATVVLLNGNDEQVVGTSSTAEGHFELFASKGDYQFMITFIGFESHSQSISLDGNMDLGNITLSPTSQEIDAVVITEHVIRREADRFIVTVANNPLSSGKDAYEMLRTAPGVWAAKSTGITINGQSGTRVMIDDRLLELSGEDLETYLHSLSASDIQRIEVIPSSGAEYSADSSGGIIKIILVKKRTSGIEGNIGIRTLWTPIYNDNYIIPNGRINYYQDKLNLYAQFGYTHSDVVTEGKEITEYASGSALSSRTEMHDKADRYNTIIGGIYDLNARHSIGLQLSYYGNNANNKQDAMSEYIYNTENYIRDTSNYSTYGNSSYFGTSVNYTLKLDDKGSTFKILGDWNGNIGNNDNRYHTMSHIFNPNENVTDKTYRNTSDSRYNVYSLGADVDLISSASSNIKFGAKYTYNEMYSKQFYQELVGLTWVEANENANQPTDYNENIGAIYGVYSQKFGIVSASFGLRGEYTAYNPKYTDSSSGETVEYNKSYIDIFPTLNINIPFNSTQTHMLIGNFSRRISRPGFWALNPFRTQLSEYSYIMGNPDLKPTYSNNAVLSYIYKYRYSFMVGIQFLENSVQQAVSRDPLNENILMYRYSNIPISRQYYISIVAPFTLTDWWSVFFSSYLAMQEQKMETDDANRYNLIESLTISNSFILPKKWGIELSFWGRTPYMSANIVFSPMTNLSLSVTKQIDRWTFGASISNMLLREVTYDISDSNFEKMTYMRGGTGGWMQVGLSLRYNFNAGVKFRPRTVESGTDENRIGGGASTPTGNQ